MSSLTAEDRLDILELMARYSWAADSNDAVGFAATFARDAVIAHRDARTAPGEETILTRGRASIEAGLPSNYALRAGGQHHTHNHTISESAGTVRHRCFWSLVKPDERGVLSTLAMGAYEDELIRDADEGWLLARRTIVTGYPPVR